MRLGLQSTAQTGVRGAPGLRDLLYSSFRSLTVGALVGLFIVVIAVLALAGSIVASSTRETTLRIARRNLTEIAIREVDLRNDLFERIASSARILQRDQQEILEHSVLHPAPRGPITMAVADNGNAFKVENNGGASVVVPARSPLTAELVDLAQRTEAFDPLMQSVLASTPEAIVAIYFNSPESFSRYVPFIDDVAHQFDPTLDSRLFNFYYVADEAHDPKGIPMWTDAYLDPAGQGWMVTCAVPIRVGGRLAGVTGIDVTIEKLVKSVVDLPLPSGGVAMLTTADGQILAMGPALEERLGLKELVKHDYEGKAVHEEMLKPEEFRVSKSSSPGVRAFFERALAQAHVGETEDTELGGQAYVAAHGSLEATGWRLFVFTPRDELLAPLNALRTRATQVVVIVVVLFVVAALVAAAEVLRRSARIAGAIASPLRRLSEETSMVGTALSPRTFEPVGIVEIDALSSNFGRMVVELGERQQAFLDAAVARNVQQKTQELLLKVLPESIVSRMLRGESVIADAHEAVSVIFADVVGFTTFAARLEPQDVVRILERVFIAFDEVARRYGIEKIKTIGDAYMAVAGVPFACPDHAERAARAALAMQRALESVDVGHTLVIRIGIHSGPAVAGVIGKDKFLYDLWGDTVNIASRLESQGIPGKIQVSEDTKVLIEDRFELEPRGVVELKGRGPIMAYWLEGEREDAIPSTKAAL